MTEKTTTSNLETAQTPAIEPIGSNGEVWYKTPRGKLISALSALALAGSGVAVLGGGESSSPSSITTTVEYDENGDIISRETTETFNNPSTSKPVAEETESAMSSGINITETNSGIFMSRIGEDGQEKVLVDLELPRAKNMPLEDVAYQLGMINIYSFYDEEGYVRPELLPYLYAYATDGAGGSLYNSHLQLLRENDGSNGEYGFIEGTFGMDIKDVLGGSVAEGRVEASVNWFYHRHGNILNGTKQRVDYLSNITYVYDEDKGQWTVFKFLPEGEGIITELPSEE